MEVFYIILRGLCLFAAACVALVYLIMQLWQSVPHKSFQVLTRDYFIFVFVSLCTGLGLNNYVGLFTFVPLFLFKFLAHRLISKNKVRGSGRWIEVQWLRFTPKGFEMPREAQQQLGKLPGNQHFLLPKILFSWAITFFLTSLRKNQKKIMPNGPLSQEAKAFEMFESTVARMKKLDKDKTEKLTLPFGELKITRL